MANFKKKPTIREVASTVVEVNNRLNQTINIMQNLDNLLGMYIRMEDKLEDFNKYIEEQAKKMKEMQNDKKENGKPNTKNIQPNSGNEGSRSKRVRKKNK